MSQRNAMLVKMCFMTESQSLCGSFGLKSGGNVFFGTLILSDTGKDTFC